MPEGSCDFVTTVLNVKYGYKMDHFTRLEAPTPKMGIHYTASFLPSALMCTQKGLECVRITMSTMNVFCILRHQEPICRICLILIWL